MLVVGWVCVRGVSNEGVAGLLRLGLSELCSSNKKYEASAHGRQPCPQSSFSQSQVSLSEAGKCRLVPNSLSLPFLGPVSENKKRRLEGLQSSFWLQEIILIALRNGLHSAPAYLTPQPIRTCSFLCQTERF